MLHNITKPRPWRGGAEVIEDVFEDAQPLKKVDVKRQKWRDHWQVDTPEQRMDDKQRVGGSQSFQRGTTESCKGLRNARPLPAAKFLEYFACNFSTSER